jgi:eukaryotic-like serine/threonine-protein kinase
MSQSTGDRAGPSSEREGDGGAPLTSVWRTTATAKERAAMPGADAAQERFAALPAAKFVERGLIGRGGSGVVVRAFDNDILREVAVKVLFAEVADGDRQAERFVEEARITGQLEHPNIIPVYEFGLQENGRRYLCMKVVDGENLEDVLMRLGPSRLDPDVLADLLQVFIKVCEAVAFAHSRGVIHRDLKPRNVMISDFGQVYVVDWGIARVQGKADEPRVQLSADGLDRGRTDTPGALAGTLCYMAPEQLEGREAAVNERTDVFALGGMLYQILTGRPPIGPESFRPIYKRPPLSIEPPGDTVPGSRVPTELSRIAMRALAHEPGDRYPSVAELKGDVEAFQRGAWRLPRVSLRAGSVVIEEGAAGDTAYVVQEGECAAYRLEDGAEVVLRIMGPGEVFGETAVFTSKPRTASVKALTDVVLLVVTRDELAGAVGLNTWMGAFVKALAERFREVDEKVRLLEKRSADTSPR